MNWLENQVSYKYPQKPSDNNLTRTRQQNTQEGEEGNPPTNMWNTIISLSNKVLRKMNLDKFSTTIREGNSTKANIGTKRKQARFDGACWNA